jgi:SAM-dependent methyltransferase
MTTASAVTIERWRTAQSAELSFWRDMDFHELVKACAEKTEFWAQLEPTQVADLLAGKDVLAIGCGPLGLSVVSFSGLGTSVRRLIKTDPLPLLSVHDTRPAQAAWASKFFDWTEQLARDGEYVQTAGEDLAFDSCFDTVITYNVLDHVRAPTAILDNASRALRRGGTLIVGVDCLSVIGQLRFELITRRLHPGTILVDAHPHTFRPRDVIAMIEGAGLRMVAIHGLPGSARRLAGRHFRPAFIATK